MNAKIETSSIHFYVNKIYFIDLLLIYFQINVEEDGKKNKMH